MTKSIMADLPNQLIMRIILENTTTTNLEYHVARMTWAPSTFRWLGFNGFPRQVNQII